MPVRPQPLSAHTMKGARLFVRRLNSMSAQRVGHMKTYRPVFLLLVALTLSPSLMIAQSAADLGDAPSATLLPSASRNSQFSATYTRPTQKLRLRNYFFDAFGPYPIAGAAIAAGINQADNTPPEWGQGAAGYGRRFGSDFGIAAVTTTTRYALARAFGQDTLYYRCACKGVLPRLSHAVISTLTARSGDDGHRVFSFPALVAPYAGTMTAVYAWYPGRYNAEDAFRMGNYSMLGLVGTNVALEFLYSGPHSLLTRMHLNSSHGASTPEPQP
jgi:hypothetical protein